MADAGADGSLPVSVPPGAPVHVDVDLCAAERAEPTRRHAERPVHDAGRHAELRGDAAQRSPFGAKLERVIKVELARTPAETLALAPGALDAGAGALDEAFALLFGDPTEDRQQELADWPACVEPRLANRDDLNAEPIERQNILNVADHRTPEAIERPNHHDGILASVRGVHHRLELRATFCGAFDFLEYCDDIEAARSGEPIQIRTLALDGLSIGTDSQVERGAH